MENTALIEILKEMQRKYQCIVEIESVTRDIGEALSRNDRTTVQMLLGMRQEEMDKVDMCNNNIECLLTALLPEEADQVRDWIKGKADRKPESSVSEKLIEKGNALQLILRRTIDIDRQISMRLAGKDSYYK